MQKHRAVRWQQLVLFINLSKTHGRLRLAFIAWLAPQRTFDLNQLPAGTIKPLEDTLRPNMSSEAEFLGTSEGLLAVVNSDQQAVQKLGLTSSALAMPLMILKYMNEISGELNFNREFCIEAPTISLAESLFGRQNAAAADRPLTTAPCG